MYLIRPEGGAEDRDRRWEIVLEDTGFRGEEQSVNTPEGFYMARGFAIIGAWVESEPPLSVGPKSDR
jgi:hypothetical protein